MEAQNKAVLKHLNKGPITPLQALRLYGCFRLGARIYDLRAAGHKIKAKMIEVRSRNGKKRVAQYTLDKPAKGFI